MISLQPLNSLGVTTYTESLVTIHNRADASTAIHDTSLPRPFTVLGGGCNTLFVGTIAGTILHNQIKGRNVIFEDDGTVHITFGAGEDWTDAVDWTLMHGYGGLENLSLIPGSVGAAPIQNIGAYGVELKDVFVTLTALDLQSGETRIFNANDCEFIYRSSTFKTTLKGRYLITDVTLRLTKLAHRFVTHYKGLENLSLPLTPQTVADKVIALRQSKLPDPKVIGNAGSFFHNPVIPGEQFTQLKTQHPAIPHWPQNDGEVKLSMGWLIEELGWKGQMIDNRYGVYAQHAGVIVNTSPKTTGMEIYTFSQDIIQSVEEAFGVVLTREPILVRGNLNA